MADREALTLAPESRLAPAADEKKSAQPDGLWRKLRRGLLMTHTELLERLDAAVAGRVLLDEATLDHLEEALLAADLGVATTAELLDRLRRRARGPAAREVVQLRRWLAEDVEALLLQSAVPPAASAWPRVTLLVGVNGTGKTTSAAKLAAWSVAAGSRPLLVAADTFRAAAVEQLALWAHRLGVDCVRQGPGADPAAVVFDGLQAARARGATHVIVDTAGRLHTKRNLMDELAKVRRVVEAEAADWARLALLVVDATTGQNAVAQAREFARAAPLDGVLLTKLDGTARGGVVVAIARELSLPVLYLGVGEKAEDLVEFRAHEFAVALLGD